MKDSQWTTASLIVIYDGHCALCTASVAKIHRRMGRTVCGVDFRQTCVDELHPQLSESRCAARIHVLEGHQIYSGAHALVRILRHHPVYRTVVWLYRVPPIGWLSERLYELVARHRMTLSRWLGRREACTDACSLHSHRTD